MSSPIRQLSQDFNRLIALNTEIENLQDDIKNKLNKLRLEYSNFRKQNKESLHVFCLDSIHFQLRLYNSYYENYMNIFKNINNHIYRDYYKLWKRLKQYVETSVSDKKIMLLFENLQFPVYDDILVDKTYKLDIIKDIHNSILSILSSLIKHCKITIDHIPDQDKLVQQGYDIDNLSYIV